MNTVSDRDRWRRAAPLLCVILLSACEAQSWHWEQAAAEQGLTAAALSLSWTSSPGVSGWIYSYGISWEVCHETSVAERLGLISPAYASHPLTFDDPSQWRWQNPVQLGQDGKERFERALPPGQYCGLRWLFSHGGKPVGDTLASMNLSATSGTFAKSSHAASVSIPFERPVCVGPGSPEVVITLETSTWLDGVQGAQNPLLGARDAWLSLGDHLTVSNDPCP